MLLIRLLVMWGSDCLKSVFWFLIIEVLSVGFFFFFSMLVIDIDIWCRVVNCVISLFKIIVWCLLGFGLILWINLVSKGM